MASLRSVAGRLGQGQVDRAELAAAQTALASTQAKLQEDMPQIVQLTARVEELEKPVKTPEKFADVAFPDPKGNANRKKKRRRCWKGRLGQGRPLHLDPGRTVDDHLSTCPHCHAELAAHEQ